MRTALVVGAGIAGPVTAVGLQAAGFQPTLVEAYPEAASLAAGAWLTLAVNGIAALRALALDAPVLAAGFPSATIELLTGTGRVLGVVPLGGTLPDGTITQTLRRADLYRALLEQAEARGVEVRFGRRLVEVHHPRRLPGGLPDPAGGVLARFDDGTEAHADLLVGADGVHSVTRTLLDPRAPRPRPSGLGNVGGFVPGAAVDIPDGTYRMIFGKRAFFGYVRHPSGEVWWFANPPVPYPADPDAEWLASLFDDDAGPAAALVRATPGPLVFATQSELPHVPVWHRGAAVIIGDAAHAASPTSGQGASLAAEDGLTLAACLRAGPVAEALPAFEAARRARVERVVDEASRTSSHKIPGPLGRWARDLVLPAVLAAQATVSRAWLYDHRVDWPAG